MALNALNLSNRPLECVLPTRARKAGAFRSLNRIKQPVGVVVLEITLNPFRTETAFVEREFFPRFKTDHLVVFDQELDAALHPAETAMRLDDLIWLVASGVSFARGIVKVRAKQVDQRFFGNGKLCHRFKGGLGSAEKLSRLLASGEMRLGQRSALSLRTQIKMRATAFKVVVET